MTPDNGNNLSLETGAGSIARNELGVEASRVSFYLSTRALLVLVFLILILSSSTRLPTQFLRRQTGQYLRSKHPHTDIFSNTSQAKVITHGVIRGFHLSRLSGAGFRGLMITVALPISALCHRLTMRVEAILASRRSLVRRTGGCRPGVAHNFSRSCSRVSFSVSFMSSGKIQSAVRSGGRFH
jgi:hypothetical protein